jgi:hypothetical protein
MASWQKWYSSLHLHKGDTTDAANGSLNGNGNPLRNLRAIAVGYFEPEMTRSASLCTAFLDVLHAKHAGTIYVYFSPSKSDRSTPETQSGFVETSA